MPENKRIDTKGCAVMRGKLTTLIYNANHLTIVLKGAGRRWIAGENAKYKRYKGWEYPGDDTLLWQLLEEHWASSSLETVQPEEIGALTDAAIYTFTAIRDEDTNDLTDCDTVYAYDRYQIESEIDAMLEDGHVALTGYND